MKLIQPFAASLQRALRTVSPNCREASRLQSEATQHPLPCLPRMGLRLHLLLCGWCRRYGKQIRFLRDAAHTHPDDLTVPASGHLRPEVRERLKRALRKEAG